MSDEAHEEGTKTAGRAGVVALGTLASRLLGAVREMVIAAMFPVAITDAFFVAFTIPNALRGLLGEGASSAAFLPVLAEASQESEERKREVHARLSGTMLVVLAGVTVAGVLAAPWLTYAYAAGWGDDPEKFALTSGLARVVFPYIFFMGVFALAAAALHSARRFAVPAFAPALLNVALIISALGLTGVVPDWGLPPVYALAIGALVGGALQVIATLPSLREIGHLRMPRLGFSDPLVRRGAKLMIPLLFGLGIYQINIMLSRLYASFLPDGAQSYLYFGQRLVEIPQGMFGLAVATASLPLLSDLFQRGERAQYAKEVERGLRLILFVALPSTFALATIAAPIIEVFYARGHFGAEQVRETATCMVFQAAGIWSVSAVRTLIPAFYAAQDTKTPVLTSALNLVIFATSAYFLLDPMAHAGIALANTAAFTIQLFVLLVLVKRVCPDFTLRRVLGSVGSSLIASIGMGAVLYFATSELWPMVPEGAARWAALAGLVVMGALVFAILSALLKNPELSTLVAAIRRRVGR